MKSSLTQLNQLIKNIQNNIADRTKLRQLCQQFQKISRDVSSSSKYQYTLFLVEIYAVKLQDHKTAHRICNELIKDSRANVQVEAMLRLSYINALNHKYPLALSDLKRAQGIASKDHPQLQHMIVSFYERMIQNSHDSNFLKGLISEGQDNYQVALDHYSDELGNQHHTQENKLFAAYSIKRICSIFNDQYHEELERCNQFLKDQEDEQDNKMRDHYQNRKKYFAQIIKLIKHDQGRNTHQYQLSFQTKRLLAILKLKKALQTMPSSTPHPQLQRCIKDLQKKDFNNPNMINQFAKADFHIFEKAMQVIAEKRKQIMGEALINMKQGLMIESVRLSFNRKPPPLTKTPHRTVTWDSPPRFHLTESQVFEDRIKNFSGSYMIKVNETSSGQERRYFHFLKEDLKKTKMKLFYTDKASKASKNDDSYEIKKLKRVVEGKQTKALQRTQCDKFENQLCFALEFQSGQFRNFFVPVKEDYKQWLAVFKVFLGAGKEKSETSRMNRSMDRSADRSGTRLNKSARIDKSETRLDKSPLRSESRLTNTKSPLKKTVIMD